MTPIKQLTRGTKGSLGCGHARHDDLAARPHRDYLALWPHNLCPARALAEQNRPRAAC
jgi:hypothetical protein